MFAGLVAGRDDDLCRWRDRENFGQRRQAFGSAVRIGRQSEVKDGYRDGFPSNEVDSLLARSSGVNLVVGKSPTQLAQKPGVIINDQQRLRGGRHVVYVPA
jgi:hypothetical protein